MDARTVGDEIIAAFQDVPRPPQCVPEKFVPYGEEERMDHLTGKTWLELAAERDLVEQHIQDHFYYMSSECLLYLFPGYLLAVIRYDAAGVTTSLLSLLCPVGRTQWATERMSYVWENLTLTQKKAVVHWLQLLLEKDVRAQPEKYKDGGTSAYKIAFETRRHWLE
jgi:hypothetical protein